MFDMRYHIASLVAVFLALTVGLLLGSVIVDKGMLAKQQEQLVASIKSDVDRVTQENKNMQAELAKIKGYQEQIVTAAIKNRLSEQTVLVVTFTPEQQETYQQIAKAIIEAGGQVQQLKVDLAKLDFNNKELTSRLWTSFNSSETATATVTAPPDFENKFWTRFGEELTGNATSTLLNALLKEGAVELDLTKVPYKNIVVVAAAKEQTSNRDLLLIEALKNKPQLSRLLGVETAAQKPSRAAAYKLKEISTIDNIDESPGRISLILLLQNPDLKGNFGIKATAERLMP
jgi:hypothetical protein